MHHHVPAQNILPLLFIALLAMLSLPVIVKADVAPVDVPVDLQAAIETKVEAEGRQYVGLCGSVDQSANIGKFCATVVTLTATTAEVTYGPVLSEPVARITFLKADGRWTHPGGGPGEGPSTAVPLDLREAIKTHVEARGHSYAGLCTEIAQDGSNIGKYCGAADDISATSASVSYGPVASNDITTVTFHRVNGTWRPATGSPAPGPPATGSGIRNDDHSPLGPAAMGIAGLAVAMALGSLAYRHSQHR